MLSHMTIVKTMDSSDRGMNPAAMTIVNPRKAYRPTRGSNEPTPVLKSATLPAQLWGSAEGIVKLRALLDSSIRVSFNNDL